MNINNCPPIQIPRPDSAEPAPLSTTEKYLKALQDLESTLSVSQYAYQLRPADFCGKHRLSHYFFPACVALGYVTFKNKGRRKLYEPGPLIFEPNIGDADAIRKWINTKTNGKPPKSVRNSGTGQRHRRSADVVVNQPPRTPGDTRAGVIDRQSTIDRIQSSFFNRLCPQCAETLHQIIDILKS